MDEKPKNKPQAEIDIPSHGPMKVTGNFIIKDIAKGTEEKMTEVWLCRCGKSGTKPFCDDSHNR